MKTISLVIEVHESDSELDIAVIFDLAKYALCNKLYGRRLCNASEKSVGRLTIQESKK